MEKIKLAYQDYYLGKHTQTGYTLKNALDKTFGEDVAHVTGDGPWTITVGDKSYNLALDGKVTLANSSSGGSSTATTYAAYTVGQEVTVGGEDFYVLEASDASQSTVTLLAKYNLNQAGTAQSPNASSTDTGVVFSSTIYWASTHALYYSDNDNGWNPCPKEYDSKDNSIVTSTWTKTYLDLNKENEYGFAASSGDAIYKAKAYATSKGGTNGRLLTYEEANSLITSYSDMILGTANQNEKGQYFLDYWLSSAWPKNNNEVMYLRGNLGNADAQRFDLANGVRPVLSIQKSFVS